MTTKELATISIFNPTLASQFGYGGFDAPERLGRKARELFSIWQDYIPKRESLDEIGSKILLSAFAEYFDCDLDIWRDFCEYVSESEYLMGDHNKRFTFSIVWALQQENILNVLDGKYHSSERDESEDSSFDVPEHLVQRGRGVSFLDEQIGMKARDARVAAGLSQRELGKRIRIYGQQVYHYECGRCRVSASRLFLISEALGVGIAGFNPMKQGLPLGVKSSSFSTKVVADVCVGENIRKYRRATGLFQRELGKRIGVTDAMASYYERGIKKISASRLFLAAKALGVSVEEFFVSRQEEHEINQSVLVFGQDQNLQVRV